VYINNPGCDEFEQASIIEVPSRTNRRISFQTPARSLPKIKKNALSHAMVCNRGQKVINDFENSSYCAEHNLSNYFEETPQYIVYNTEIPSKRPKLYENFNDRNIILKNPSNHVKSHHIDDSTKIVSRMKDNYY
jgi:hypothetical protein